MAAGPINDNVSPICTICQDEINFVTFEIEDGEKLRLLPCMHVFHEVCILNWEAYDISNTEGDTCPNCRQIFRKSSVTMRLSKSARSSANRVRGLFERALRGAICH